MKPTAMQRPPDKGGKMKDTTPPSTLSKHPATVTVVCNGVRSSASSPSLTTDYRLSDDFSQTHIEKEREDGSPQHRSVIKIGSNRTPPVSQRVRPQSMLEKSPKPVQPRPHSTVGSFSVPDAGATNGHDHGGSNCVTDLDFFASLPPLPSDDHVAGPFTFTADSTSSNASTTAFSDFPPPPPPDENGDEHSITITENAGASASYPTTVQNTYSDAELKHREVSFGDTTTYVGHTASNVEYTARYGGQSAPMAELMTPSGGQFPPPVARKPIVSRPPPMSGISENGSFHETSEEDDTFVEIPSEKFHIHMKQTTDNKGANAAATCNASDESTFVGRRDVRDPRSLHERQIVSAKGTVRGFKNRVRAGIATFILDFPSNKANYRQLEKGRILVYTTSMAVVRETHDRCRAACNILQTHMVRYEARDLYMSRENQRELRERLETTRQVELPQIFADGIHLGGAEDLENLNESGELRTILESFPKIQVRIMCDQCGGYRWVPCSACHGSKKSVHRNNFTEEFCALRCMQCNESGLQRCQMCLDQQE